MIKQPVPKEYVRTHADQLAISQGCYWDEDAANRPLRFAANYYHPQFVSGNFQLLPWQEHYIRQLYGWRLPGGSRRWSKSLLSTAKKSGKNLLCGLLCLYELVAAGTPDAFVISCSTTRENSTQVFKEVAHSIQATPQLASMSKCRPSTRVIRVPKKNAEFRSISCDAGNAEGLNVSFCVVDEAHAHRTPDLYRAIEYSTIARQDGHLAIISTAGSDFSHFFRDIWVKAENILKGTDLDTSMFVELHVIPEGKDIEDPDNWHLCCPSIGTSFTKEAFARDLQAAKSNLADWLSFQRYRLNRWVAQADSWIDPRKFDEGDGTIPESVLREAPCFVAADLSQTVDISAVACVWCLGQKRFYLRTHGFVCAEGTKRRREGNLPAYDIWAKEGSLTLTAGDVADYPAIKSYILDLASRYQVKEVVFDQYNAMEMCLELASHGLTVFRFPQNYRHFTHPVKEFERAVVERRLVHPPNNCLRWQLQNVTLDVDPQGNCRVSRKRSGDKVDNVIASIMGFGRALEASAEIIVKPSCYEDRGVLIL